MRFLKLFLVPLAFVGSIGIATAGHAAEVVKIGFNYPRTGPYYMQGRDELQATELAVEEINAAGGILGKKVEIVWRNSQSKVDVSIKNIEELIDKEGVVMVFGGASSAVAAAMNEVCEKKQVVCFDTLTYSTTITAADGHRHNFRECYDSAMGARAMKNYLKKNFAGKKYFYITANYNWGLDSDATIRKYTDTTDTTKYPTVLVPFPNATPEDFKKAVDAAEAAKPDVVVMSLFGTDLSNTARIMKARGMNVQKITPAIHLSMAEDAGPGVLDGTISTTPWDWRVPYKYNYPRGIKFVEDYAAKYKRYPSAASAFAYAIMWEYKSAVERANSFRDVDVIKALEDHEYTILKDKQKWRKFDHQSLQSVYMLKVNPQEVVAKDKFKLDYFEIGDRMSAEETATPAAEWKAARAKAGKPPTLEKLPGE